MVSLQEDSLFILNTNKLNISNRDFFSFTFILIVRQHPFLLLNDQGCGVVFFFSI